MIKKWLRAREIRGNGAGRRILVIGLLFTTVNLGGWRCDIWANAMNNYWCDELQKCANFHESSVRNCVTTSGYSECNERKYDSGKSDAFGYPIYNYCKYCQPSSDNIFCYQGIYGSSLDERDEPNFCPKKRYFNQYLGNVCADC
jgi:hypothetical protein